MAELRYIVISDTDSRLKWAAAAAAALRNNGCSGDVVLVRSAAGPSPEQLRDMDLQPPLRQGSIAELATLEFLGAYDVAILGLMGPDLGRFIRQVEQAVADKRPRRRPLLVTGYWGITGTRDIEGLLWRLGCDVVCINNAHDLGVFKAVLANCRRNAGFLVPTGVFSLPPEPAAVASAADPGRVLFVGQPNVPRTRYAKAYLLHHLIAYAERHPNRTLVIKPRMRPGERATHREGFSLESLVAERHAPLPGNLRFEYGAMAPMLAQADLVLTISSAAAIEAWAHGRPVALISDFGIDETLGNPFYVGSNAFARFADIIDDKLPTVDRDWLAAYAISPGFAPAHLHRRLADLARQQLERGAALPLEPRYVTETSHPLAFGPVDVRRYHRGRPFAVLRNLLGRLRQQWADRAELFE